MGCLAYAMKNRVLLENHFLTGLTRYSSAVLGMTLVAIGLFGIYDSYGANVSAELSHSESKTSIPYVLIFGNGFFHGFSIDGAIGLAPSIVQNSWSQSLVFLLAYVTATTIVVTAAGAAISAVSKSLGQVAKIPDLSEKLSRYTSIGAVAFGILCIMNFLVSSSSSSGFSSIK